MVRGKSTPGDQYAAPLARILGVDVDYLSACLMVARGRDKDLSYWRRRASREFHAAAIASVNLLLEEAADNCDKEGREYLLLAAKIRARVRSMREGG